MNIPRPGSRWLTGAIALALLAALAGALYLPYLGNPLLFDDRFFFSGRGFSHYASSPVGFGIRIPAYFSLALVEVLVGGVKAHRVASLVLHVACAGALYALVRSLQLGRLAAFGAAALFAVHPVAVYGAGYLVQRSILLATLFSLLSLLMFLRGQRKGSASDFVVAALLFSLAVLSKEHAILVPATALALAPLGGVGRRAALRNTAIYWAACAPAALFVVLLSKGVIGQAYEPYFDAVATQATNAYWGEVLASPWIGSAIVQAALFFQYIALWLLPTTSSMSLDLRVQFAELWSPAVALPAVFAFCGWIALSAYLVFRRGRIGVAAWGALYFWIMFLPELATVRYQEPFVLYRSYLWAPGLAVAVAAGIDWLATPRRVLALLVPALAVLAWQAHDRLESLSSGLAAWEDAVAKLPAGAIPGGYRPLYEVGREYLYADRVQDALRVTDRCMALYPTTFDCYFARGAIHMELKEYEKALPYIIRAARLRPADGGTRHHLGLILENLGCIDDAMAQYRLATQLRFAGAEYRIERLVSPGSGFLPPQAEPPVIRGDCARLLAKTPKG
jgi:tetratricopeptide (TPR) repeat protein